MDIILDSSLTDCHDHKFIDELQFSVNQMLANESLESIRLNTSTDTCIVIERTDNKIYVRKQED